ncbi:MerR family transcriptional regulator [Brachybacterium sacelli]|uniref:DNA-binding transcriptional MerR regulator n=1 Tax=Brachybacterium sacelli TaxID=173364 RepID=A0ABS4X4P0_9MICO|nr:MerR family transcriptional regulator [Brachybacterium sacelli]MBP2383341.1 DNA-binding transcriptional MerR regulator [Brachybacterium sacelli]
MTWSTRQLAELARTSVNTVRHYHKVGLLPEPERAANGYKLYRAAHLIRLLQITRLSELGIPLAQIAAVDRDDPDARDQLRRVDAELEESIARLTRARADLAQVLEHRAPAVTPAGFAELAPGLTDAQQSLLAVYATVFDASAVEEFREALADPQETDREFEELPADADADVIDDLARRMVPGTRRTRREHPGLVDPTPSAPDGGHAAREAMAHALVELYNPAQLQVLGRLDELLAQQPDQDPAPPSGPRGRERRRAAGDR